MRNCLTDIAGLRVGHAHDETLRSGVTAVIFDRPAIAAASLLGGAPAVRDTALLSLDNAVERVDAIVLSGGSVYGLDATAGLHAAWRRDGWGLAGTAPRSVNVPVVVQASLFDLSNGGAKDWSGPSPYPGLGECAASGATPSTSPLGSIGAGFGATTATLRGGLGAASSRTPQGHTVAVLVAVNAVGSTTLADSRYFWAAPFERDGEFGGAGWPHPLPPDLDRLRVKQPDAWGTAATAPPTGTVIGVVATDASLTPAQAHRLAIAAQDGLARAILPTHLARDGDVMFAASTEAIPLGADRDTFTELCLAATLTTARAIARGVHAASPSPGPGCPPSWSERFAR